MAESACLVHPFSYAPGLPIESKQANPMDALGDSISFGRFMTESLNWEKWSTFSHKRYVEEAERHAQPGLVAQKKAFFEDHYKRIAAKKAAEALSEQENLATDSQPMNMNPQVVVDENPETKAPDTDFDFTVVANEEDSSAQLGNDELGNELENVEKHNLFTEEKHLNSNQDASSLISEKKPVLSSLKSNIPSSPKSLDALISSAPQNPDPKSARTSVDPSASGRKTTGRKWHILSAIFCLRTEETTARRKQKLDEKLKAKEAQKVKLQTKSKKKSETEPRKSRLSLCFKARP